MPGKFENRVVWASVAAMLGALTFFSACGPKDDGRLLSYPVHGKVTVDGKPTKGVYVFLTADKQPRSEGMGIFPNGISDEKGDVWIATYDADDGAPPGDYAVTVRWPMGEGFMVHSESPDRLKGRYNDPAKSEYKITVKEATKEQPNELPALDLKSK